MSNARPDPVTLVLAMAAVAIVMFSMATCEQRTRTPYVDAAASPSEPVAHHPPTKASNF
jgi:hypothetical protein